MTTYATRSPLQPVTNTHYIMGDRRSARRTSARLMEKLDAQEVNGISYTSEKEKTNGESIRAARAAKHTGSKPKRKSGYEEDDDGFTFSRTRSKRTKMSQVVTKIPEPVEEEQQEDSKVLPTRKSRKRSVDPITSVQRVDTGSISRQRTLRSSGDKTLIEAPALTTTKKQYKPLQSSQKRIAMDISKEEAIDHDDRMDLVGAQAQTPMNRQGIATDVTKIALPFADTPIIRRNKEMRKNERRSSLGMRGRRASSLIESRTSNALPHSEVETKEFYKHIEASLPEPRRMRQLLTWCGTRAMGDEPSCATEDYRAKVAARKIQQQLLHNFANLSEMLDWFNRDDSNLEIENLRPNPRNIANANKVEELEKQLAKLQSERKCWENLLRPSDDRFSSPSFPPKAPTHEQIDVTSFDEIDNKSLTSFHGVSTSTTEPVSLQANTRARLNAVTSNIEFETDKLAGNIQVLLKHLSSGGNLGEGVLAASVKILDQRDRDAVERQGGESVGTRDVLRALSRVVER